MNPLCLMRIVFAAGWWLFCCQKRPARTWREIHPLGFIGLVLIVFGVAGQFYFAGRH